MLIHEGWLTSRATTWLLRSRRLAEPMSATIALLKPAVAKLAQRLADAASKSTLAADWIGAGVPEPLAARIASAEGLLDALDIAEVAESTKRAFDDVCDVHAGVGDRLGLARLRAQIDALSSDSYWQSRAKMALGDDLAGLQRALAQEVLAGQDGAPEEMISGWETAHAASLERARRLLADMSEAKQADLAMLSVALRELRNLV
jgi:glutamate dehydrogenase